VAIFACGGLTVELEPLKCNTPPPPSFLNVIPTAKNAPTPPPLEMSAPGER
jgi:hypothetical protein